MWNMVYENLIVQGQVNKSKYLRKCIHARQVYKGCADDSTIRYITEQVEKELTKIVTVFDERTFCRWSIGSVNIVTNLYDDIDGWAEESRLQIIITNDRH